MNLSHWKIEVQTKKKPVERSNVSQKLHEEDNVWRKPRIFYLLRHFHILARGCKLSCGAPLELFTHRRLCLHAGDHSHGHCYPQSGRILLLPQLLRLTKHRLLQYSLLPAWRTISDSNNRWLFPRRSELWHKASSENQRRGLNDKIERQRVSGRSVDIRGTLGRISNVHNSGAEHRKWQPLRILHVPGFYRIPLQTLGAWVPSCARACHWRRREDLETDRGKHCGTRLGLFPKRTRWDCQKKLSRGLPCAVSWPKRYKSKVYWRWKHN